MTSGLVQSLGITVARAGPFTVDESVLNRFLGHVYSLALAAKRANIDFILLGYLSLVLHSRRAFRSPNDIDAAIDHKDASTWFNLLAHDWDWTDLYGEQQYYELFAANLLRRFAASDPLKSSLEEALRSVYQIRDGSFSIVSEPAAKRVFSGVKHQPKYLVHNPAAPIDERRWFVDRHPTSPLFRLNCYSDSVGQYYRVFAVFYSNTMMPLRAVECSWVYDIGKGRSRQAVWSSPWLPYGEYEDTLYTLVIGKAMYPLRFVNYSDKTVLDAWASKETTLTPSGIPIKYAYFPQIMDKESLEFADLELSVAPARFTRAIKSTYNRTKDVEDLKLFDAIFAPGSTPDSSPEGFS